jgi:DNA-binding NarL/FixJ family response regulator
VTDLVDFASATLTRRAPLRIVIVDHSVVARTGLGSLLASQPSITVVGQAQDGQSGIDLIRRVTPDVALVDLEMPDISGLEVTRRVGELTKVLITTYLDDSLHVSGAIRAGARGYLVFQDLRADELVSAIHTVAAGGTALSPRVTPHLFNLLREGGGHLDDSANHRCGLTAREAQTMDLVARGMTNAEVAMQLCLSVKTVKNSMSNIYRRLAVTHRSAAVATWLGVTVSEQSASMR